MGIGCDEKPINCTNFSNVKRNNKSNYLFLLAINNFNLQSIEFVLQWFVLRQNFYNYRHAR